MKKSTLVLFPVLAGALLAPATARADVVWQHLGRVTVGGKPVASFDFRNYWSGDKHRAQLSYDLTAAARAFATEAGEMDMVPVPLKGMGATIERLDDDRLLFLLPDMNIHLDEPYKSLKSRLRFNIWEGIDAGLAKEPAPPELTPAQRQRLGHEMRAVIRPFTKEFNKTYFRPLPKTRTINGMTCHGYRYTTITDTGNSYEGSQWLKVSAEWWIANPMPADQQILNFTTKANDLKQAGGPATASMWVNELSPILWEAAPEEAHAALASLIGKTGQPDYGFKGTPVQFFVTLSAPPDARMMPGDLRVAIKLQTYGIGPVAADKFEAPAGSARQPLEPALQIGRNMYKQALASVKKGYETAIKARRERMSGGDDEY